MDIDNILYTPLDCPIQPEYSIAEIKQWALNNKDELFVKKEELNDAALVSERVEANYPWDLTTVYKKYLPTDTGWVAGFNLQFPELALYFTAAFNISLEDVGLILLLPVKADNIGLGFWHQDPDNYGLRMYLEYEAQDANKLLLRKKKRFTTNGDEAYLDRSANSTVYECRPISNKQCFFLNNVNAQHSTWTSEPNKTRIAVLIVGKLDAESQLVWKNNIKNLVVNSAQKFSDYAIIY